MAPSLRGVVGGDDDREGFSVHGLSLRPARAGDGADLAQAWLEGGRYYADLSPRRFRVPEEIGLANWIESSLATNRGEDESWTVAELDGDVIGDVRARVERPTRDARWQSMRDLGASMLKIDSLMVREDHRRRGVAPPS